MSNLSKKITIKFNWLNILYMYTNNGKKKKEEQHHNSYIINILYYS